MSITTKKTVSADFQELVGVKKATRGDLTKKVWEYVKANDLQHPNDGRVIVCDDLLYELSGKKKLTIGDVARMISAHIED